ncbi:3-oxoacyl-[acyl-carrier-protein] synthase II [Clostridium acetobutylicum]|uniref:3-oxoacyl-(Acyl-carrier-protein) synthase n=1 Tax=Clostridium acetobutylicum (strain ATCC 824 / DSM 792 / JCM 1419 / IAM 19013 / LMG 5710 / NBRC 13948 / NRRL B-527 / VKM B-1787 / 2291 / W) TaxID=272562 RepID=Q97HK3_CLOAB|nr:MULTISPECIES: beta-ketoacyl-[acyl-carrier-protein] synthase family protein [Clostridium]AAK79967.1 3-oxoacyl-(acyl-carrier-protein) synthase [Clostridium acetobutylicum ATCC 824]ADZ21060.1 3-oxoacyl-(acyl-carrier-protein) synthase [Clostridium acetobutylicum EA 2018]AEI34721.1 3-oxoacyl-(acyl-carrier-protein) synthase [Clostridium acetobutylicum DSM 1731]AWV79601.1 beta-ketoacyl-[acyl-carrier-protein] synthase family protein [Clostridium acetobutylicum]MBC2394425.1 beta-ketoacyl-[acyl-carri
MESYNKTVITGMGMITSVGLNLKDTWNNLVKGVSGVTTITSFDTKSIDTHIAAPVSDEFEELAKVQIPKKDRKRMTRSTRMLMVAVNEAVSAANINFENYDKTRIAVIMGIVSTGYDEVEKKAGNMHMVVKSMPNSPSAWVSLKYGLEGPNFSVSTACASSAYAIGLGQQMIKSGLADVVIVGGVDSHINAEYIDGFNKIMAMSTRNDSPSTASRPFSLSRDGFVMGEGAGVMVLEAEKIARARNAKIYGELAGYAITSEAVDITAPKKDGEGMLKTMQMALNNANINPYEVDYINAHGTSTYLNDKYETFAIKKCFGERAKEVPVSSSKSMIGHTIAASGVIEGIITVMSICSGVITPTINYQDADPELDLDYVPNHSRAQDIHIALSNSFGFGGHNATVVYRRY